MRVPGDGFNFGAKKIPASWPEPWTSAIPLEPNRLHDSLTCLTPEARRRESQWPNELDEISRTNAVVVFNSLISENRSAAGSGAVKPISSSGRSVSQGRVHG